jgi:hypothetical protein
MPSMNIHQKFAAHSLENHRTNVVLSDRHFGLMLGAPYHNFYHKFVCHLHLSLKPNTMLSIDEQQQIIRININHHSGTNKKLSVFQCTDNQKLIVKIISLDRYMVSSMPSLNIQRIKFAHG